jgi:glycosyltransferase involved in cell wall biosynthesis
VLFVGLAELRCEFYLLCVLPKRECSGRVKGIQRVFFQQGVVVKVLFISHDGSATGAPFVLLELIRRIQPELELGSTVLFKRRGPLVSEFAKHARVLFWPSAASSWIELLVNRINSLLGRKSHFRKAVLRLMIRVGRFDLVYVNTVDSLDLLGDLAGSFSCPVVCHVHELQYTIESYCGVDKVAHGLPLVNNFIVVAQVVGDNLSSQFHVPKEKMVVIPPVVRRLESSAVERNEPAEPLTVLCVGQPGWRKGTDVVIHLAKYLTDTLPEMPVKFVWLGSMGRVADLESRFDIEAASMGGRIEFLGHVSDPGRFYAAADVFLLPSREDPFPLVAMEAAAFGVPIIAFKGAGGISEHVAKWNSGVAVDYLSIVELAKAVVEYQKSPSLRKMHGENAVKSTADFDPGLVASKIWSVMTEAASRS